MKYDSLDEFQAETRRTAGDDRLEILALGLCGEAGELGDLIKKHVGHGHPLDVDKALKELGDILWYAARIADALSASLSGVAARNVEKLRERYPEGFSTQASMQRVDVIGREKAERIVSEYIASRDGDDE